MSGNGYEPMLTYSQWVARFIELVKPVGVGDLQDLWSVAELKQYHTDHLTPQMAFDIIYSDERNEALRHV